jgi:beta-glucosidase-like glycosyl hydrolase
VRFLAAGGDLALICRDRATHAAALGAVAAALAEERLVVASARRRRAALRAWAAARPAPDVAVIGCHEHRALAEEVARRAEG